MARTTRRQQRSAKVLNLGCGTRTSVHSSVINIDRSILMRIRTIPALRILAPLLLNGDRRVRFRTLPDNIVLHDLARGIPFPDCSVDVVYHSHLLEHLDRDAAPGFIRECARVLRPGGLIRVVVPDFERSCREYLGHVALCEESGDPAVEVHDSLIEPLLLMSVQREAHGTSQQRPLRRFVENLLLGDARRRGETHQWMYDRFNLAALLQSCGFSNPRLCRHDSSSYPDWHALLLDSDDSGAEYKPNSLYMEATKPGLTEVNTNCVC